VDEDNKSESIIDSINKGSKKEHSRPQYDWEVIVNTKGRNAEFLNELAQGANASHRMTTDSGHSITFRLLTPYEESTILPSFVSTALEYSHHKLNEEKQKESEYTLNTIIRLMMATTDYDQVNMKSDFYDYVRNAQLSFYDLGWRANLTTLTLLAREYQYLQENLNPNIYQLSRERIRELIESIKKQQLSLRDFSYNALLQISDELLQSIAQMDRYLQNLSSDSQSKNES
jgi:hypothetical protein